MLWLIATVAAIALIVAALRFWRAWIQPWRELELIVSDIVKGRAPRTFIINGNRRAERIGIALEDVLTRQRELNERATEDELNIRTITGAMRDGLAVIGADARVRFINPAARKLFGVDHDTAGEKAIEAFRDAAIADLLMQTLRDSEPRTQSVNVQTNAREQRQVAVSSLPMPRDDGTSAGTLLLFHDVTQLQQLEQVRRGFVSNVSHELRTPLSIFRGYLETLLDEPDLPRDERERILHVMERHSDRLHALVDDLLSLARLEAPDPRLRFEAVNLREFLSRISKEWEKRAAAKQLNIQSEIAPDVDFITADQGRLEEVIYNLLDNAVKYSPAGGEIVVRVSRDEARVTISVSDEGAGIATADLPRIFERFYRADKARSREVGGTGLGLAIVKHIVQLHGGSVEAESQLGSGTTIRVKLPISREQAAH